MDLVFTTPSGGPINNTTLTLAFQKLLQALGLPRQRFQDLRHAAASFTLTQNVSMKVVSEKLGHANIAIIADRYSHVSPTQTLDATTRVEELLSMSR